MLNDALGVSLDVGNLTPQSDAPTVEEDGLADDGTQVLDIGSRLVAHIFHRTPGLRKVEKRMEGEDKKAGILSDMGTFVMNLYARNEDAFDSLISDLLSGKFKPGSKRPINADVPSSLDFGVVGDPSDNNGGSSNA